MGSGVFVWPFEAHFGSLQKAKRDLRYANRKSRGKLQRWDVWSALLHIWNWKSQLKQKLRTTYRLCQLD